MIIFFFYRELQRKLSYLRCKIRYNFPAYYSLLHLHAVATVITKDDRFSVRSIVVKAKEDRSYAT